MFLSRFGNLNCGERDFLLGIKRCNFEIAESITSHAVSNLTTNVKFYTKKERFLNNVAFAQLHCFQILSIIYDFCLHVKQILPII